MGVEAVVAVIGALLGGGLLQFIAGFMKDRRDSKKDEELKPERERGVALESAEKAVLVLDASLRAESAGRERAEQSCARLTEELEEAHEEIERLRIQMRARVISLEAELDALRGELRAMVTRAEALAHELANCRGDQQGQLEL